MHYTMLSRVRTREDTLSMLINEVVNIVCT